MWTLIEMLDEQLEQSIEALEERLATLEERVTLEPARRDMLKELLNTEDVLSYEEVM